MTQPTRRAAVSRQTAETKIYAELSLDGDGIAGIKSGIAFFDHMLSQLVFHGRLDLNLTATGDTAIDAHHTVKIAALFLASAGPSAWRQIRYCAFWLRLRSFG